MGNAEVFAPQVTQVNRTKFPERRYFLHISERLRKNLFAYTALYVAFSLDLDQGSYDVANGIQTWNVKSWNLGKSSEILYKNKVKVLHPRLDELNQFLSMLDVFELKFGSFRLKLEVGSDG